MSNPLDFLKKFFKIEVFNKLKKGKLGIIVGVLSGNKLYQVINNNNIVINCTSPQAEEIIKTLFDNDNAFFSFKRNESLNTLKEYCDSTSGDDIVEFFRGKISEEDFIILSIAKYITTLFQSKNMVLANKSRGEVQNKYGQRGLNIVNLYSEGYFATSFKPLYEILQESGDPNFINDFNEVLKIYIDNPTIILFVPHSKPYEQVKVDFQNLIERNIEYGIYRVNIHGISRDNVEKIERLLLEFKDILEVCETKKIRGSIMVKLSLKNENNNSMPERRSVLAQIST